MTQVVHVYDCVREYDAFLEMKPSDTVSDLIAVYFMQFPSASGAGRKLHAYLNDRYVSPSAPLSSIGLQPASVLVLQASTKLQQSDKKKITLLTHSSNRSPRTFPACAFAAPQPKQN